MNRFLSALHQLWSRLALFPLAMLALGASAPSGVLHVAVDNVRARTGRVHVDLCTQAQFLKDCPTSADAPARIGQTTVTLPA